MRSSIFLDFSQIVYLTASLQVLCFHLSSDFVTAVPLALQGGRILSVDSIEKMLK